MNPRADEILEWLEKEMGYRNPPSVDAIAKICRGNMLPIWKFLLERVKSEKTVEKMRRNLHVHGSDIVVPSSLMLKEKEQRLKDTEKSLPNASEEDPTGGAGGKQLVEKGRRRPPDGKVSKVPTGGGGSSARGGKGKEMKEKEELNDERGESRERALQERDAAEKEVATLRLALDRLTKEMKARMADIAKEEGERRRLLDEKSDSRYKQVLLEAYDQRCEQAIKILSECWRRLHSYVEQARESQRGKTGWSEAAAPDYMRIRREPALYATAMKGRLIEDEIVIETAEERSIRLTCEMISANLVEKIRAAFPAYDGDAARAEIQLRDTRLGLEVDTVDGIPDQVRETALRLLKSPQQLLQAMVNYTSRVVTAIQRETEEIDIRADAEHLRYRFENNRITEDVSSLKDKSSLASQSNGEEKTKGGLDSSSNGMFKQLRDRQTAHVQQFMATEQMLNQAADAKKESEEVVRRMYGVPNGEEAALPMNGSDGPQNAGSLRHLQLEVWSKERELGGLRASVDKLQSEVQRLTMMCEERRQAKEDLRQKWRKIEEFNARRMELESIYTALIHANMAAAASWEQHMVAAREHSTNTILPVCAMLQNQVTDASDLIEREVTAFLRNPDNRQYLFPAFPQGLIDATGAGNSAGPEAVAAAQKNADLLTARAGAGDPSAISSINRISAALQNPTAEGTDAGLVAVVESLQAFFGHRVSAANLLEDVTKSVNQMQVLRDLVNNNRMLLGSANSARPEYERNVEACATTAAEQEKVELEQWLPELKAAVQEAQKCLEYSKHVRELVDEWWEQPASTAVDWITVDGQNVAAWLAHVKQLQATFYEKQLL
ncbi:unnamed protein product [Calypogeia fissa]